MADSTKPKRLGDRRSVLERRPINGNVDMLLRLDDTSKFTLLQTTGYGRVRIGRSKQRENQELDGRCHDDGCQEPDGTDESHRGTSVANDHNGSQQQ
jgi:hypothetical protein